MAPGREIVCCWDCAEKRGWTKEYEASDLRVLGLFDDSSGCFVCGKYVGGACFKVPRPADGLTRNERVEA